MALIPPRAAPARATQPAVAAIWALALAACGGGTAFPDAGDVPAATDVVPEMAPRCGDGVVTGAEQCDDGNRADGDGCDRDCTFSCAADADCDDGNACNGAEACDTAAHRCRAGATLAEGAACDADGNAGTRDVCRAGQCRASTCGDGYVDPMLGEVCDDGNRVEGDGCDSDCTRSCATDADCADANPCNGVETCDPTRHACRSGTPQADGTVCGAGGSCRGGACAPATCGNGLIEPGEECDDGNTARWDGCDRACRFEQTVRATELTMLAMGLGCDLDGDGSVNNRLGEAMTPAALDQLNAELRQALDNGYTNLLVTLLELDDRLGQDDRHVPLGFFNALDARPPFENAPDEAFTIGADELDAAGAPRALLPSASITRGVLEAGPGTASLLLALTGPASHVTLTRLRLSGTVVSDATMGRIAGVRDGRMCGAIPAAELDRLQLPTTLPSNCRPPDGRPSSLLDLLVVGCRIVSPFVNPTQPDVDEGGDGLAGVALEDTNGDRVVDTCRDGRTGTVITGDDCAQDPRFDDGYSAALRVAAARVRISAVR